MILLLQAVATYVQTADTEDIGWNYDVNDWLTSQYTRLLKAAE